MVMVKLRTGLIAASLGLMGCSSLTVTRINSAEAKPNNVWVFFTVEERDEPVAGLQASDFEIYEDNQLVSTFESQQTIQNPDVAAVMYTMLLLDMSGSVTESGEVDMLIDAAGRFVSQVEEAQKVGIFAFDGEEDIKSVVPFTEATGSVEGGLEGLRGYKAKDPSTNLHGAVIQGLETLDKALQKDKRPLKFGTLVVFSDGTDRAARVSRSEMLDAVDDPRYSDFEVYAIGVGAELEDRVLGQLGRDGVEMADDTEGVSEAFERVATRIKNQTKRFYLLSYCSPSRKGEHMVRIEAKRRNDKDRVNGTGSLEYPFDADDFGPPPACDPERSPTFRLDRNLNTPNDGESSSRPKKHVRASASANVNR